MCRSGQERNYLEESYYNKCKVMYMFVSVCMFVCICKCLYQCARVSFLYHYLVIISVSRPPFRHTQSTFLRSRHGMRGHAAHRPASFDPAAAPKPMPIRWSPWPSLAAPCLWWVTGQKTRHFQTPETSCRSDLSYRGRLHADKILCGSSFRNLSACVTAQW